MLLSTAYGMPPGNCETERGLSGEAAPGLMLGECSYWVRAVAGRGLVLEQEAVRGLGLALELSLELEPVQDRWLEPGQEHWLEQRAFQGLGLELELEEIGDISDFRAARLPLTAQRWQSF